jgi:hypothetical protein
MLMSTMPLDCAELSLQSCETRVTFTSASAELSLWALQLFMFSGFHGRSSASAVQLAQHSALEQRLAALQDDNAQLRTMYKHLESQLSMASAELGCERSVSACAASAIRDASCTTVTSYDRWI